MQYAFASEVSDADHSDVKINPDFSYAGHEVFLGRDQQNVQFNSFPLSNVAFSKVTPKPCLR